MSLEAALKDLRESLRNWHESLTAFRQTVVADSDLHDPPALVRDLGDRLIGAETDCEQALTMVDQCSKVGSGTDPVQVRSLLGSLHPLINGLAHCVTTQVSGYDIICQLEELRSRPGGQWQRWLQPVWQSVDFQPALILAVHNALASAWEELNDAASRGGVHVRNVAIAQHHFRDRYASVGDARCNGEMAPHKHG